MKKVLVLMAGILFAAANLYAGNGDLIVNGNMGVGTTTVPETSLAVKGKIRAIRSGSTSYADYTAEAGVALLDSSSGYFYFVRGGTGNYATGTTMMMDNTGYVGIGTTNPGYKLDVGGGGIRIDGKSALTNNAYFVGSADYGFRWNSSDEAYNNVIMYDNGNMYIRGKVGIGTTTPDPDYKLTVVGGGLTTEGIWQNSDIKLKKNILPVEGALDKILKLNGVSYEWKHDKDFEGETLEALKTDEEGKIKDDKYRNLPDDRTLGVIAQELENVLPEAVNTGEDGIKAVSYTKIIPVLIEAMKEQQKQISDQQKRIEELEKKVAQLK